MAVAAAAPPPRPAPPPPPSLAAAARGHGYGHLPPCRLAVRACAAAATAAAAAALAALGSRAGPLRRRQGCLRGRRRAGHGAAARVGRCRMAAAGGDGAAAYVPIIVQVADGEEFQLEISLADTVRSFKAVVQMELEVAEENQEVFLGETALTDETARLGECGIKEGSKIRVVVKEDEAAEPEDKEVIDNETGEILKQIVVKCNLAAGKTKEVLIPYKASETFLSLKEKAYDKFVDMTDVLGRLPPKAYGLVKMKTADIDKAGPTQWVQREDRLKDEWTVDESLVAEDEEVHLVHLFYIS